MRVRGMVVAGLMALAAAAPAHAAAASAGAPFFAADTTHLGRIGLYLADLPGTTAQFAEQVGGRRVALERAVVGPQAAVSLPDAAHWSCTRRTRRFIADVRHPDGTRASATYAVRTPGCEDRLLVDVARWAAPGSLVPVTVRDRWSLGNVRPRLCVRSPLGHRRCRAVRFAGAPSAVVHVRLTRDGTWHLELRLGRVATRRTLVAGPPPTHADAPAKRPTLLVSGDSSVEGIDADLGDRLHRTVRLVRDFRVGTGLSHDSDDWPAIAAHQAQRFRPRVTVISIGANEGFPMRVADGGTVACCGAAWQAEYEHRARAVMTSLARGGHGHVLWLTLPTPSDPRRAAISDTVNAVDERVAPTVPGVVLVRLDRALSPGDRFRHALRYHGRRRVVRTPDGIHLSPAGAAIASELIMRTLARLPGALGDG